MPIYVFDPDGKCLERNQVNPAPPLEAFQANHGPGVILHAVDHDPYPEAPLNELTGHIEGGVVTGMELIPTAQAPAVYLHLGIGGGDGDDPPGIVNDGQQALLVDVALRAGPDPGSPVLPVSGDWRVTIRDDTGAIYDVVRLTITAGQAQVSYTSNQRPAVCQILERDFIPVQAGGVIYQVRLVGRPVFKVYRVL